MVSAKELAVSDISKTSIVSDRSTLTQTKSSQNVEAAKGDRPSAVASAKQQLNVQILELSAKTSIQSGNQPQALLFSAAIDRINEILAPELGANAIQSKASEDNSPEATAERILSLSTGFFDAYAAQHPDDPPEKVAQDFIDLVRSGFEQGFKEAADILEGLQVFDGDIKDGIMKTYELVSKGYDDFLASKLPTTGTPSASDSNTPPTSAESS
jgi:hypothetical protein